MRYQYLYSLIYLIYYFKKRFSFFFFITFFPAFPKKKKKANHLHPALLTAHAACWSSAFADIWRPSKTVLDKWSNQMSWHKLIWAAPPSVSLSLPCHHQWEEEEKKKRKFHWLSPSIFYLISSCTQRPG